MRIRAEVEKLNGNDSNDSAARSDQMKILLGILECHNFFFRPDEIAVTIPEDVVLVPPG